MARSKSPSGGKTNKEQTSTGNPTSVPDVQAVAAEATAIKPEAKVSPEAGSGSEAEDWLAAEREVRQRYHQQQSA